MCVRHLIEVRILGDNRQAVRDGGGRNQRIGQADGAMEASAATIVDQMRPGHHHRLAEGNRIGLPRKCEGVGAAGPNLAVISSQHAELQFAEADDRDRHAIGQLTQRSRDFSGDEYPGVQ